MPFFYISVHCWMSNWSLKSLLILVWMILFLCPLSVCLVSSRQAQHRQTEHLSEQDGDRSRCRLRAGALALRAGRSSKTGLLGYGRAAACTACIRAQKTRFKPGSGRSQNTSSCLCFWPLPTPFPWEEGSQVPAGSGPICNIEWLP